MISFLAVATMLSSLTTGGVASPQWYGQPGSIGSFYPGTTQIYGQTGPFRSIYSGGGVAPSPFYGQTGPIGSIYPSGSTSYGQTGSIAPAKVPSYAPPAPAKPVPKVQTPAQKVVAYIRDPKHAADINPACFWSGQTTVTTIVNNKPVKSTKTAQAALSAFKGPPRNCHSLAEIVVKSGQQASRLNSTDWRRVSKALAQSASGKAYALLGQQIRSNATWFTDEKPALIANKKVALEVWEIQSDGSVAKVAA
ncbi:hypothetical protein GALMADRAFT_1353062 [Galerina marginata CBS 339.88]|uniref:Uncharacterized protein n=1 Tax=Galerina marginata (strain CBS 339.88) TaxID=685588 RepID=A0A067SGC4_GALM3|nr:hypothetical protein GALMADRAFT_1353062 [Galerina marginata CBS 339.88]